MKIKVVSSFSAIVQEEMVSFTGGQILDMPAGADWIKAGLAIAVEGELPDVLVSETAVFEPAEAAVPKTPGKRKPK